MNFLKYNLVGFFSRVEYAETYQDHSWSALAEKLADKCRAPARGLAKEIWGGGARYIVNYIQNSDFGKEFKAEKVPATPSAAWKKVVKIICGLILGAFGELLALPLMGLAYMNPEIQLKHQLVEYRLPEGQLEKIVQDRLNINQAGKLIPKN